MGLALLWFSFPVFAGKHQCQFGGEVKCILGSKICDMGSEHDDILLEV